MSLSTALIILGSAGGLMGLLNLYYRYAKLQVERLHCYEVWTDKFFHEAKHLLGMNIPEQWEATIAEINEMIDGPNMPHLIYVFYKRKAKLEKGPAALPEDERKFADAHPDIAE